MLCFPVKYHNGDCVVNGDFKFVTLCLSLAPLRQKIVIN